MQLSYNREKDKTINFYIRKNNLNFICSFHFFFIPLHHESIKVQINIGGYSMETVRVPKTENETTECKRIANYILNILGHKSVISFAGMSERTRQFFTWGAHNYAYFATEKNNVGLQFEVKGLKFKGLVRVIYCYATDYFNVEFIKISRVNILKDMNRKLGLSPNMLKCYEQKLTCIKEIEDLDFTQIHNVLHKFIEREDDPEV